MEFLSRKCNEYQSKICVICLRDFFSEGGVLSFPFLFSFPFYYLPFISWALFIERGMDSL